MGGAEDWTRKGGGGGRWGLVRNIGVLMEISRA